MFGLLSSGVGMLLTQMQLFLTSFMMFLTGTETTGGFLDLELVDNVMDMVVSVVTKFAVLFTIWPLNLFLILAIIGFCVSFFFIGKKGARRS